MNTPESVEGGSPPQEFRVRLTHVATIPMYVLSSYLILLNQIDTQLIPRHFQTHGSDDVCSTARMVSASRTYFGLSVTRSSMLPARY